MKPIISAAALASAINFDWGSTDGLPLASSRRMGRLWRLANAIDRYDLDAGAHAVAVAEVGDFLDGATGSEIEVARHALPKRACALLRGIIERRERLDLRDRIATGTASERQCDAFAAHVARLHVEARQRGNSFA